jgi:hypothetical protein
MTIKYTNIFQYRALQNMTKVVFFKMKIDHLATLELWPLFNLLNITSMFWAFLG